MASLSSKILPYASIGGGFALAILAALGYGPQMDKALDLLTFILPITSGGGLVNEFITMLRERQKKFQTPELEETVRDIVEQIKEEENKPAAPSNGQG